jgi:hypothetical protein
MDQEITIGLLKIVLLQPSLYQLSLTAIVHAIYKVNQFLKYVSKYVGIVS